MEAWNEIGLIEAQTYTIVSHTTPSGWRVRRHPSHTSRPPHLTCLLSLCVCVCVYMLACVVRVVLRVVLGHSGMVWYGGEQLIRIPNRSWRARRSKETHTEKKKNNNTHSHTLACHDIDMLVCVHAPAVCCFLRARVGFSLDASAQWSHAGVVVTQTTSNQAHKYKQARSKREHPAEQTTDDGG